VSPLAVGWVTISALATAGGTLVLAIATFASVRSANRSARVAERSLLAGLRPLLVHSRLDDPTQKISFADDRWLVVEGGRAAAEASVEAVYLAISVRNAGAGIALLHGWRFYPERVLGNTDQPPLGSFTRLSRDIYVAAGDVGFWQGTFRDPTTAAFAEAAATVMGRRPFSVDVLYGDHEGGQRTITRFGVLPYGEETWFASAARYWNVDRDDPR
jgi:hypothetical protein